MRRGELDNAPAPEFWINVRCLVVIAKKYKFVRGLGPNTEQIAWLNDQHECRFTGVKFGDLKKERKILEGAGAWIAEYIEFPSIADMRTKMGRRESVVCYVTSDLSEVSMDGSCISFDDFKDQVGKYR